MSRISFIVTAALLSASSIGNQEHPLQTSREPQYQDYREALVVVETHSYGVSEPAESPEAWGSIYSLTPGPDGGVLVTDPRLNAVYHVVPDRGVVATFGAGEGDGPGEFRYATVAVWNGHGEVFVADRRQMRTSVFSVDGPYLRSFSCHNLFTAAIDAEEVMWTSSLSRMNPDYLRRYDTKTGEYLGEVGGGDSRESTISEGTIGMVASTPERVFAVKSYPYEIVEYASSGIIRRRFGRLVRWMRPPTQDQVGAWLPNGGAIGGIGCWPDGKVIVFVARMLEDAPGFQGYFDVFDSDGNWITTIPADDLSKDRMAVRMTVARDGAFWVNWHGDYPTLKRYEFSFR